MGERPAKNYSGTYIRSPGAVCVLDRIQSALDRLTVRPTHEYQVRQA